MIGRVLALLVLLSLPLVSAAERETIVVGTKTFTESYVLGELMAQVLESSGHTVERRFGFGGTLICFEALRNGDIDLYPEYGGTIQRAIYGGLLADKDIARRLDSDGLRLLGEFGFNNTYALAMPGELAQQLNIRNISDLRDHPDLEIGLSHEFLSRADGWPGLQQRYGLTQTARGIEHGLAYQALREGEIQLTDAYSTDGEVPRYRLTLLQDDLGFFPRYMAAPLVRNELPASATQALQRLAGILDEARMQQLNGAVVIEGREIADVAADFLESEGLLGQRTDSASMWQRLLRNTLTHLQLTGIALFLGCVAGLLAGVAVHRSPRMSRAVLHTASLIQTIPSIALLALMIPLLGVGKPPAIAALFVYSLLPILASTVTALRCVDPVLSRVATALGLTRWHQIRHVQLPLAMPHILSGIRTAAVISIGTATLAAFIGAGGLGQPIVTGLALNDPALILEGAVPAALLAVLTELGFELLERRLVAPPLRTREDF
ncbi:MAG: glycine betaine ABC transporter substrate-binding protein [Chromatiales bacterium]|jgi:osmoprotectant transport system permease protein